MVAALSVQLKKKKQQRPTANSTASSSPSSSSPSSPKGPRARSPRAASSNSNSTTSSVNSSPVLTAAQRKRKKYREKKKQANIANNNNTQNTDISDFEDSASEREMPPTATAVPVKDDIKSAMSLAQKTPPSSADSNTSSSSFKTAPAASKQVPLGTSADVDAEPAFFDSVASLVNMTDSIAQVGENETEEHHVETLTAKIIQHEAPTFADVAADRENAPDVSELPPIIPEDVAAAKAQQDESNENPAFSSELRKPNDESRLTKVDEKSIDITTSLTEKIEEHKAPDFASVAANKARVPEEVKIAADLVAEQVIAAEKRHLGDTHNEDEEPAHQNSQVVEQHAKEGDVDINTSLADKINEERAPRFADVAANKAHVPEEVNLAADIVAEHVAEAEKQHILETTVIDTETPLSEKIEQHKAPSFASVAANKDHVPVEVKLAAEITAEKVHAQEEEIISARQIEREIDTETPLAEKIMEHRAPSFADVAGDRSEVPQAVIISADLIAEHVHEEETKRHEELEKQRLAAEEKAKEMKKAEKAAKEEAAKTAATKKQNNATSQETKKMPIGTLLDRADTKLHETVNEADDSRTVVKTASDDTTTTPAPSTTSTVTASPSTTHHEPREIFVAHNTQLNSNLGRRYSTGETEAEYAERRRREHKVNRALENRRKLGPASLVIGNATIGALLGAITAVVLAATGTSTRFRWMNNVTKTRASGVGIAVGAAMGLIEWIWLGKSQSKSA